MWDLRWTVSFSFGINFPSVISGTRDDSLPPAPSCVRKPVINETGSPGRGARFPEEATGAQLMLPL